MSTPTIIFEEADLLVINKPVGLAVHGDGYKNEVTVADWFLAHYPAAKGVGEPMANKEGTPIERSGVVHRLDIETSGVMVLAKTDTAYTHLKQQFHDRLAKKTYRALVYGHLHEQWGEIDRPIGRSAKNFRLRSAERGAKGTIREATTAWERIGQGEYEGEPFAYLELKPKTGRMHQLRVHLKAIDRPIVGDPLYAGKRLEQSNNLGLNRLALHAHTLEITLLSGEPERFVAPIPEVLEAAADLLHEA